MTEIAPSQHLALETLFHAWLNAMVGVENKSSYRLAINKTIGNLVSSFKGTDAVTLLAFLANLLPRLEPKVRSRPCSIQYDFYRLIAVQGSPTSSYLDQANREVHIQSCC